MSPNVDKIKIDKKCETFGIINCNNLFVNLDQRVLGLTWRPRRMSLFVHQKPVEISKNDSNTN